MPLVIPKRHNRSHAVLPITLTTTASLVVALCYLQLIYLTSYLLRCLSSYHRDFPPLKETIERVEKLVIDLIVGIVPFANYRSPTPTDLLHGDHPHRIGYPVHVYASRVTLDNVPHHPAGFVTPPNLPQCYPGTALGRTTPNQDQRLEVASQSPLDPHGSHGSSIYDTVKKTSSARPKASAVVEVAPVTTQQFARSSLSLRQVQEPEEACHAPERHHSTSRIVQKSPACSMDGPSDLATILQTASPVELSVDDGDELKLDRATKCRSTESYPGKFPVSDSMEFSSLATASYAFRERGTTSVRPFSDY